LLDQAGRLLDWPTSGRPRQADLKRAISTAYYAIFHAAMGAAADQIVGTDRRTQSLYALVYRSADHAALRMLCQELSRLTVAPKYQRHVPSKGFNSRLREFASVVVDLQKLRHSSDYDPFFRISKSDAALAISSARVALDHFERVPPDEKAIFLYLLLFKVR
jgi:hypothetical protein